MTCPECDNNPNYSSDRCALNGGVPFEHPTGIPNLKIGEIIARNPNSYNTVKQVLLNLQSQCEIGKTKEWVRVGCDGLPYSIANKLIYDVILCKVCNDYIDTGKETIESHFINANPENTNVEFTKVMASRSDKPLNQVRKSVFDNFEFKDPSDEHGSTFNFDKEVQMFRTAIRKSNLRLEEPLKSLDGQ
ncbi:unnamed protein product [Mytilus coruscus]|uniref:Uncharacterized protein n=1 Tax=Mytilus coruscus TaxID=42192 RepID=A0A6J8ERF2_MYTCO|nr:unnamed protein product [Mytilus coruscus]